MLENFLNFVPLLAIIWELQLYWSLEWSKYTFEWVAESDISEEKIEIVRLDGSLVDVVHESVYMKAGDELLFEYKIDVEYF